MWSPRKRAGDELERRLVWMLGSPRSGSTWLTRLLAAQPGIATVGEPHIGIHLAPFPPGVSERISVYSRVQADRPDYFFNDAQASVWGPPLRRLILERLAVEAGDAPTVVVKEPHGSQAADVICSLLPASRLLFLLRDGRDVVDSEVAALEPDAWLGRELGSRLPRAELVALQARIWLLRTEIVEEAYEAHDPGLRLRVRYEDLLTDPGAELERLLRWLGRPVERERIARAVAENAFEALPDTGPRSFARAATPGLWRRNLTGEEQAVLSEILGPKLVELGYESA